MAKFTERELKEIKRMFAVFDKDGNGKICIKELSKVLRSLGQKPTEQELKTLMAEADKDGSGAISFPEFLNMLDPSMVRSMSMNNLPPAAEMEAAFKKFDKDGDGLITVFELRQTLNAMNVDAKDKLTDYEASQLVREADMDGDSMINYQEFVQMMFVNDD